MVTVPEPLTRFHTPLPGGIKALPCKLVLVIGVQRLWSGPALAGNWAASNTRTVTCALLLGKMQGPLEMVHWNTLLPTLMSVRVVTGEFGEVMVPEPLTKVHTPVAGVTGVLPVTVTKFGEVGTQMLAFPVAVTGGCALSNTMIDTSSSVRPLLQGPLLTVHLNLFTPTPKPVTPEVGLLDVVMVPLPDTSDHVPVAGKVKVLPANVAVLLPEQSSWSGPALATGLFWSNTRMRTWSCVLPLGHGPLLTDHRKMLSPTARPVICVVDEFGDTMVPVPLINVHVPVAGGIKLLPLSVAVSVGVHSSWFGPALATGLASLNTVIDTTSCVTGLAHGPLVSVHRKVSTPTDSPETTVPGLLAFTNVPVPFTTDQWPVAGNTALLPASVVLVAGVQSCWSAPALAAGALAS